jgi:hypothetical protein
MFNPGGFDPVLFATKWLVTVNQNVTKVAGAHTLKVGGFYEWVNNSQPGNNNSNGQLEFATWTGNTTGNVFSDILTGRGINTYNESTQNVVRDMAYNIFEFYVQDSWKVRPRVTLDAGVRASHLGAWAARNDFGMATWNPALYDPSRRSTPTAGSRGRRATGRAALRGPDAGLLLGAACRLRLGRAGHRPDRRAGRLWHVQLPRRAGAGRGARWTFRPGTS